MRVETETATNQKPAEVAEDASGQVASEMGGPEGTGDAKDTRGAEDIRQPEDATSDDIETGGAEDIEPPAPWRRIKWSRVLAFGVLPALALLIATAAGFLKWQDAWIRGSAVAGIESVAAAKESTVALLSYQPDTVEKDLGAARDRLTGSFKDSYTQLIHDVVIPGAKKQRISAVATVPAAASVSATPKRTVALLFVDQTVVVGDDAPTETSSAVRVTMDNIGGRWLISAFDPV